MTDEQIVKALECCSSRKNCEENCPYFELKKNFFECVQVSTSDAIELIKRQQGQIEDLTEKYERATSHCALFFDKYFDKKCEKESLEKTFKEVEAKAIKEFAEKLKEIAGSSVAVNNGQEMYETKCYNIMAYKLDNLVKEMVEHLAKEMEGDYNA